MKERCPKIEACEFCACVARFKMSVRGRRGHQMKGSYQMIEAWEHNACERSVIELLIGGTHRRLSTDSKPYLSVTQLLGCNKRMRLS